MTSPEGLKHSVDDRPSGPSKHQGQPVPHLGVHPANHWTDTRTVTESATTRRTPARTSSPRCSKPAGMAMTAGRVRLGHDLIRLRMLATLGWSSNGSRC